LHIDEIHVDMQFLEEAVSLLDDGVTAVVVGSKRVAGADDQRSIARKVVTAGFSLTMRYGFGLKASDTHGLKALRRDALEPLVLACRSGGDIFDTELVLRAERAGLHVRELPVTVVEQRPPRTSVWRRIPRTIVGLARLHRSLARPAGGHPPASASSRRRTRRLPHPSDASSSHRPEDNAAQYNS
jgi:hypothetical protein